MSLADMPAWERGYWSLTATADETVAYHQRRGASFHQGVVRFALAQLEEAYRDLHDRSATYCYEGGRSFWRSADQSTGWIERTDDDPGSFVWCVQIVGLDPDAVREAIRKPPRRPLAARQSDAGA